MESQVPDTLQKGHINPAVLVSSSGVASIQLESTGSCMDFWIDHPAKSGNDLHKLEYCIMCSGSLSDCIRNYRGI